MKSLIRLPLMFLSALALGVGAAHAKESGQRVGPHPYGKGTVGLQLYSLRDNFAKDVPATLAQVRDLGFKYVELAGTYGLSPSAFRQQIKAHKLVPLAGHFAYEKFRDDAESVARDAKALGLQYAGCAWIPHDGPFTEAKCREAIATFNHAGQVLAKHGIRFYYHQHGYEFEPYGSDTLLDLMMAETDPRYVAFEMDIFWVFYPGQDPVAWLDKYGKRWELMHVKDLKNGVKVGDRSGHADVRNDVAVGTGQMDIPAILKAAKRAKTKLFFIEDESPSVLQQLPHSLLYLRRLQW